MTPGVTSLNRQFIFKNNGTEIKLSDPDPSRTPDQVMSLLSNQYPSLTTATVHGPTFQNDKAVYEFKTTVGTKG